MGTGLLPPNDPLSSFRLFKNPSLGGKPAEGKESEIEKNVY
jgi:hypothetical protein